MINAEVGKEDQTLEKGQLNKWETVPSEKVGRSRSPKQSLTYGRVVIATPSRFAALNTSGENGEDIIQEENT